MIIHGDSLQEVKKMDDKSIDCVITSPPYWQLRDYGFSEQWGLEKTYQEYLEHLWSLMDELYRVLKDTGTVWINLGDSYSSDNKGHGGSNSKKLKIKGKRNFQEFDCGISKVDIKEPKKSLLLIPHRFAIGCIDRGWILRNDIIWAKRNGMPESVTDRFSKKHEFIFMMVKQQKYYFDLDGVRTPYTEPMNRWGGDNLVAKGQSNWDDGTGQESYRDRNMRPNSNGKNPGDVSDFWDIPTRPSSAKHYATFNTDLIDKPIIAGCPKGGIILDPFCGTGTTLIRGLQLNRQVIGIDGKKEYCDSAKERIKQELSQLKLAI